MNIHKDYKILQVVGSGSFSTVYKAISEKDNQIVCIKQISKAHYASDDDIRFLKREVKIASEMDHPFIVKMHRVFEDEDHLYMVMDYFPNGTLLDYVNTHGKLGEIEAKHYFKQMLHALDYLHNNKRVTHRDLKFENFMFTDNYEIKLIDFGFSTHFGEGNPLMKTTCGSFCYVAPELFQSSSYTQAVDVWSLGVILYGMVFGSLPFLGDEQSLIQKIINEPVPYPSIFITELLKDLLSKLFEKDPEKRITVKEALNHPWLAPSIPNRSKVVKSFDLSTASPSNEKIRLVINQFSTGRRTNGSASPSPTTATTMPQNLTRPRFRKRYSDLTHISLKMTKMNNSHNFLPPLLLS